MTINNINSLTGNAPVRSETGKAAHLRGEPSAVDKGDQGAARSAATDSVSLSERAARLQGLEAIITNTPEVDSERVAAVRQAIADGSYVVDTARLAEQLIQFESALTR